MVNLKVNHDEDGHESPEGGAGLVGVEVVVQHPVDEVGHQSQIDRHRPISPPPVAVAQGPVCSKPHVTACKEDPQYDEGPGDALLCQRAQVFAVGVAAVGIVGRNNGAVFGPLVGCVDKLVGTRSPACKRSI